ncbi:MAG: L-threonine 3-dehydrogenase [Bacilli bacterium]|jgi:nucleoside-diphosphate-sugar epimerase|nr:L-threonine 3-dehydrogenase [Bacilli bacterium]
MRKILITGSLGQIGSELTHKLREVYGQENVIASARRQPEDNPVVTEGIFEIVDVMDYENFLAIAKKHQVNTIIHLAALLSAKAEEEPAQAWHLNMQSLINALEVAKEVKALFFTCSSIGAFGPSSPKDNTPQDTIQRPTTMYGITKLAGELLCDYYFNKYGVDTRSVRFPGLISYQTLPGGGTTDYAVHIYYDAIKQKAYTSFINKGTTMDMMYMPDALNAIIQLIEADPNQLIHRNAFNVSAMAFDPEEIAVSIKKYIPEFKISYDVDPIRQGIADSWPNAMDISAAQQEWGFKTEYDLDKMTQDMLKQLSQK